METAANRFNTTEGQGYSTPGLINVHPTGWTYNEHYTALGGFCGQNCPCCRAQFQEALQLIGIDKLKIEKMSEGR